MPRRGAVLKRKVVRADRSKRPAPVAQIRAKGGKEIVSASVLFGERELKLARALADSERKVREASLASLQTWLRDNASAIAKSESDIDKLWKALFYCVWMTDKPLVIESVIKDVVNFADIIGWPFLNGLYQCIIREWPGIDRHRVDKFYALLSTALSKSASRILGGKDDESFLQDIQTLTTLMSRIASETSFKEGKGVILHVVDEWCQVVMVPSMNKAVGFQEQTAASAWGFLSEWFLPLLASADPRLSGFKNRLRREIVQKLPSVVESVEGLSTPGALLERTANKIMDVLGNAKTKDHTNRDFQEAIGLRVTAFEMSKTARCEESLEKPDIPRNT